MVNDIKIAKKLIGGFVIVASLIAIIGVLGINNMSTINNMLGTLYNNHLIGINRVQDANVDLICIGRALRQIVLAKNEEERQVQINYIEKYSEHLKSSMDEAEKTIITDEGKKQLEAVMSGYNEYMGEVNNFLNIIKKSEYLKVNDAILNGLANAKVKADTVDDRMSNLADSKEKLGKQMFIDSNNVYTNMRTILIFFVIAATFLGIFIGYFLSRSISMPLSKTVEMIQEMSMGHFNKRLKLNRKDEIGVMAGALDNYANELQNAIIVVMKQISEGNISANVAGKDDKDELAPALKGIIESLRGLISETKMLTAEAINGNLSKRGRSEDFKGAYREIVEGLNKTLDEVTTPINETSTVLVNVANRDLTARVKGAYKGDHAKLKDAVNTTIDNLDSALSQVSMATEQVSSASQQISSGSQSLAQGANEQASSLEEVSSSLEEMASMTKQNAENAAEAKNLATEANSNATLGKEAVNRMANAINKIKESSDQTAKIVKTIDEIAMQTNLLALNAAVEAARAGEAGRGFAVVAEEVRNLAQRSAQAAKNTADMIAESVKNSEEGVRITGEVANSFLTITEGAQKVDALISDIATASQEQSQGIEQVNSAVAQLDKIIQQNAANSEESASAAEELNSQAEELQNMINQFELTQASSASSRFESKSSAAHNSFSLNSKTAVVEPDAIKSSEKKFKNSKSNSKGQKQSKSVNQNEIALNVDDNALLKDF